jgi:thiol:disulfide interchange protein DsbC
MQEQSWSAGVILDKLGPSTTSNVSRRHLLLAAGMSAAVLSIGTAIALQKRRETRDEFVPEPATQDMLKSAMAHKAFAQVRTYPGGRDLFLVSDPQCRYCSRLETELNKVTGINIHLIIAPHTPEARIQQLAVMCSTDPAQTWQKVMTGLEVFPAETCEYSAIYAKQLLNDLQAGMTPTMFRSDGARIEGYVNSQTIMRFLGLG